MRFVTRFTALGALAVLAWPTASTAAEMRGVTATEIKIGQTMPYSGPVSAFGALALQLPFRKVSESMGNHDSKIVGADSVD